MGNVDRRRNHRCRIRYLRLSCRLREYCSGRIDIPSARHHIGNRGWKSLPRIGPPFSRLFIAKRRKRRQSQGACAYASPGPAPPPHGPRRLPLQSETFRPARSRHRPLHFPVPSETFRPAPSHPPSAPSSSSIGNLQASRRSRRYARCLSAQGYAPLLAPDQSRQWAIFRMEAIRLRAGFVWDRRLSCTGRLH